MKPICEYKKIIISEETFSHTHLTLCHSNNQCLEITGDAVARFQTFFNQTFAEKFLSINYDDICIVTKTNLTIERFYIKNFLKFSKLTLDGCFCEKIYENWLNKKKTLSGQTKTLRHRKSMLKSLLTTSFHLMSQTHFYRRFSRYFFPFGQDQFRIVKC